MYTLTTTIELPIAHRLEGAYSGLCRGDVGRDKKRFSSGNDFPGIPHGHNYIITVDIMTEYTNEDGMVIDFKKVKEILKEFFDKFDHSIILKAGDHLAEYYKNIYHNYLGVEMDNVRLYEWPQNPTAEYMCYRWHGELLPLFKNILPNARLRISVEETSHNKVSYEE